MGEEIVEAAIPFISLSETDEAMQATMQGIRGSIDAEAERFRESGLSKEHITVWRNVITETIWAHPVPFLGLQKETRPTIQ
ncbi:hypothetical protein AA309_10560 [Microvirga vignae]|uniref:Uncharacterized protein n=1 Tax=Microvirga vignae TaxID=1225564 RepID=A0A0H1RDR2_9HYPH|nr:hypothetical protein [Microvirga vignae]KLK93016.1 hypothetical protein AA309_10560 [Microvirga vignae]